MTPKTEQIADLLRFRYKVKARELMIGKQMLFVPLTPEMIPLMPNGLKSVFKFVKKVSQTLSGK